MKSMKVTEAYVGTQTEEEVIVTIWLEDEHGNGYRADVRLDKLELKLS